MVEHLTEILAFTLMAVFAIAARWMVNLFGRWLDVENAERTANALNGIVEDAVLAIEEEARTAVLGQKPTGSMKRELAIGIITRMLQERKATVPLDIIVGKINATVHRLFNHERLRSIP